MLNGKNEMRSELGEIVPIRPAGAVANDPDWRARPGFKVLELDDAARQRAAWKRVLRYAPLWESDLTVA